MTVSISFSGGLYYALVYQTGVLQYLQDRYDLKDVVFLGDSSGSMVAYAAAVNIPARKFLEERIIPPTLACLSMPFCGTGHWKDIQLRCNEKMGLSLVTDSLTLPIQNRLHVSITRVDGIFLRNEVVSVFHSDRDAAEAVMASSHIPFLMTPHMFAVWRGAKWLDGGISGHRPVLDARTCVIHPELWRSHAFWLKHGCVTIPSAKQARWSYRLGYEDAAKQDEYFQRHGLRLASANASNVLGAVADTDTAAAGSTVALSVNLKLPALQNERHAENESDTDDDENSAAARPHDGEAGQRNSLCTWISNRSWRCFRQAKTYGFMLVNIVGSQFAYRLSRSTTLRDVGRAEQGTGKT